MKAIIRWAWHAAIHVLSRSQVGRTINTQVPGTTRRRNLTLTCNAVGGSHQTVGHYHRIIRALAGAVVKQNHARLPCTVTLVVWPYTQLRVHIVSAIKSAIKWLGEPFCRFECSAIGCIRAHDHVLLREKGEGV